MNYEHTAHPDQSEASHKHERQTRIRKAIGGLLIASGVIGGGAFTLDHIFDKSNDESHYMMEIKDHSDTSYVPPISCWPDLDKK